MAMEAEVIARRTEEASDRRAAADRRRRERRKPGNRVNRDAPTKSNLQRFAGCAAGVCLATIVITVAGGYFAGIGVPFVAVAFEFAALAVAVILVGLGSVEQRLTEVRLELMMLNGGRRETDRRQGDRRAAA